MSVQAQVLIQAQYASITANLEYTCPAGKRAIIDKFTATNQDAGAIALTIYIVPNGQSATDSNKIIKAVSIAAGATLNISEMQNQILATGDAISVFCTVADKLTIRASGREIS